MTEKKSFLMYTSYLDNVEILSDEEAGQLLKAIYAFVNGNELPKLDRVVQLTFNPIKSHLERDKEKYDNICKRNSENGKKGGRPQNPKEPKKSERFSEKPKKADNDNENENENVNGNVNDNKNENADDNKNDSSLPELSLTQTEYETLCEKYGKKRTDSYITKVQHCARLNPKPYEDAYAVLDRWLDSGMFG